MRRDSIFYYLFRQAPPLLSQLVPNPPANAEAYRFDSVAVKEPRFEIDGVFLPPDGEPGAAGLFECVRAARLARKLCQLARSE